MPRLSKKDAELVIDLLRRHAPRQAPAQSEEGQLLKRLERRVEKSFDALENWKRRDHAQMVRNAVRGKK